VVELPGLRVFRRQALRRAEGATMTRTITLTMAEWKFLRDLMSASVGHIPDEATPALRRIQAFEIAHSKSILAKLEAKGVGRRR
jgi:hypothetical protein